MIESQLLDLYTDYLIASHALTTATGLAEMLDHTISHDQITRFLSKETYHQKTYWHEIKSLIRQIEHDDGVIVVDDTIEEKPYTDENAIVCWHYDHTKNHNVKGINLLNFVYARRFDDGTDFSLPLAFEILAKTQEYLHPKTGKPTRKSPITKNALVRGRLKILCHINQVRFRYVVWDSWFSSADNLKFVKQTLHKDAIGAIKTNRTVARSLEDKLQGKYVTVTDVDIAPGTTCLVYLQDVEFPVVFAKQLFTNQDGSSGVSYLVSTDTAQNYIALTAAYQKRWAVETFHKSLKQNASLEKSPTKVERTQRNHIFAAMLAFVKLETLKIRTTLNHFALKHRLYMNALKSSFTELQTFKQQGNTSRQLCFA